MSNGFQSEPVPTGCDLPVSMLIDDQYVGYTAGNHIDEASKILALVDGRFAETESLMAPADRVLNLIMWAQVHTRLAALLQREEELILEREARERTGT